MLATACDLDYSPSTLSLVMLLLKTNPERLSKTLEQKMFQDAQIRFRRLVGQGSDPDALTLNGLLLATRGEDTSALQSFSKAIKAYEKSGAALAPASEVAGLKEVTDDPVGEDEKDLSRRPFRWNWEASCYTGIGKILFRQGKLEEAQEAFRVAAEELDTAEGYFELAKLQPHDSLAREKYLTTAAISGNRYACLSLAELELEKAKESEEAKSHRRRAGEWLSLAGEEQMARDVRRG